MTARALLEAIAGIEANVDQIDRMPLTVYRRLRNGIKRIRAIASSLEGQAQDSERLEWLMRNVSGRELRDLGIDTFDGCTRELIDAAREGRPA